MRILILADSNWRDSFAVAHVKNELTKRLPNSLIIVASFDVAIPVTESLNPHVLLINHVMGKRNRRLSNYVKRQGGLSVIMPTEGVPVSEDQVNWFVEQNDDDRFADAYLSWNEELASRFNDIETFVTGCPRFDIYQEPYNQLIEERDIFFAKYSLEPKRDLLLFTSSFPQAKFAYRGGSFNRQDWQDLKVTEIEGREDPGKFAREEYKKLQDYKFWIRVARYTFPRTGIAVKPHPLEDITEWQKFCDELDIVLLKGEYIFNATNHAAVMIGKAGCLTHQDAWLNDIFSIHAVYDELSGPAAESINGGFSAVYTHEGLIKQIRRAYDGAWMGFEEKKKAQDKYLDKWGFSVQNSGKRVADAVAQLIEERDPQVDDIPFENYHKINQVIAQHNAENNVLKEDSLGHFGKAVTRDIIKDWLRRINAI